MGSRPKIILATVILLFALYSNLRLIDKEMDYRRHANRTAEKNRARDLDALREMLPKSGVIGYVSDQNPLESDAMRDHYQAEYALSPLLLVRDAKAPYVIVNCRYSTDGTCFVDREFVLVKEFGSGIRLYRQKQQ